MRFWTFAVVIFFGSVRPSLAAQTFSSISSSARVYGEGSISSRHDQEFLELKNKFVYQGQAIDFAKVKETVAFLKIRRDQLRETIFMYQKTSLIERSGYKNKKAEEKALEDLEDGDNHLFLYDEAIASLEALTAKSSLNEVHRILLFVTAAENYQQTHLLTEEVNTLKSAIKFFRKIKLNAPDSVEASNLQQGGRPLSVEELQNLKSQGFDLSALNPPEGPLWFDNDIENYDPKNEEFYAEGRIPKEGTDFYFKRMGRGQIKLKAYYLSKKGKKRSVNIKVGREVSPQLYASQIARILGYPSMPIVYRKDFRVFLGDVSYGEFAAEWDRLNVGTFNGSAADSARTWFSRAGQYEYDKESHSVTVFEGYVEAYPNKGKFYYKGGNYRSSRHGFVNRREYRALLAFSALINLVDNGDKNLRVDAFRNAEDESWTPFFYFNDLGTSMGNWYSSFNTLSVDEFGDQVAWKKKNGDVQLKYIRRHPHPKTYDTATASDFRWLIRRMARISEKQLLEIGLVSGLPDFLATLYAEKMKRRINNLIEAFELEDLRRLTTTPYQDLHKLYPNLISKSGKLKEEADNFDNNTWYNGPSGTLVELIQQEGSNLIHAGIANLKEITASGVFFSDVSGSLSLKGERSVEINNFHGPEQRRVRILDKWTWETALGASAGQKIIDPQSKREFYLPLGVNLNYEVSHYHSASTLKEANLKNYENVILPWKVSQIKESLKVGESLRIIESANFTVGGIKGQINEQLRLQLDVLRFLKVKVKEVYIHRYSKDEVEVVVQNVKQSGLRSGFDIKVFLELAIAIGKKTVNTDYTYVRLDLSDPAEQETQELFLKILNDKDLGGLQDQVGAFAHLTKEEAQKYFGWKFLLWGYDRDSTGTTYDIAAGETRVEPGEEPDKNDYQIFSHSLTKTFSRELSKSWDSGQVEDEDIKNKSILNSLNLLFQFFDRQNHQKVTAYVQTDAEILEIEDMVVFLDVSRTDNYIRQDKFKKRYLNAFSKIVGEKTEDYFEYRLTENQKYFSPVKGQLTMQLDLEGIKRVVNRAGRDDKFCNGDMACELSLTKITKLLKYTGSVLKTRHSRKKRQRALNTALEYTAKFFEYAVGHKTSKLRNLRRLSGDKHLWILTRINGILPNAHPFAIGRGLPLYAKEIGKYQGRSPLKKAILKYQFFPKQNFFYDSILPDVPY